MKVLFHISVSSFADIICFTNHCQDKLYSDEVCVRQEICDSKKK